MPPSSHDHQLALRISSELLAAIDAEVERVKAERPGARVQRSDVVREALMRTFFKLPETASAPVKREQPHAGEAHPGRPGRPMLAPVASLEDKSRTGR
jgi:hypothetical protein